MSTTPRLLVYLASGQLHDVPADDEWLSADERSVLAALKLAKRRSEWRLGRWLARRAVHSALRADLPPISIIAADDGAPEVLGLSSPVSLSISHRHGRGLAAACGGEAIGCDLELVEPRSERFISDWLTPHESARILAAPETERPLLANLCWSVKEAASKVLRVGLRFDTRAFDVELPDQGVMSEPVGCAWQPIAVTVLKSGEHFAGVWRARAGFVETVLARSPLEIREPD